MERTDSTLTVLMVNYNSSSHVLGCLKSLESENIVRIIILENGSGEDEWKRLQGAVKPWGTKVQLVRSHENLGFGAGVNLVSTYLPYEYLGLIWILNPDTIVTAGCAQSLVEKVTNGDLDIVSPVIATGSPSAPLVWFAGGDFNHASGTTRHLGYGGPLPSAEGIIKTDFMTGAAPLMSYSTWKRLGGFNESLFLYWEDADLSLRAQGQDLRMGVDLAAHIWHKEGGSGDDEGRSALYYFYMQKNRLVIESRYSSAINLIAGRGAIETVRLLLRPLRERQGKISKLVASAQGLAAGVQAVKIGPGHVHAAASVGEK